MNGEWIEILPTPLVVADALRFVSDAAAGGIDIFVGTTRSEKSPAHGDLLALDYEAYHEMAMAKLRALAADASARWPVTRLAILHRTGRVLVGEPSAIIAVSCPHRAEAFASCHWLIDQLKVDVPIWKKEVWSNGQEKWVSDK